MKSGMKMLMISNRENSRSREGGEMRRGGARSDMDMGYGGRMGYEGAQGAYSGMNNRSTYARSEYEGGDMEARFRDRRGREHYDNGRFAPMRSAMDGMEDNYGMESRRGRNIPMRSAMDDMEDNYGPENRRYRRYSDGRFAPRSEYKNADMAYPMTPFVPPVYEGGERGMNPIGFVPNGYGTYANHHRYNEMENRTGQMERGGASGRADKLTREMAEEWMAGLENEDGSRGPHWNMEQVKQVMAQRGIQLDPYEFGAVLNALYSDYSKVFLKHNVNKIDLYVDLTTAWLMDKDAVHNKAAAYFECVVK